MSAIAVALSGPRANPPATVTARSQKRRTILATSREALRVCSASTSTGSRMLRSWRPSAVARECGATRNLQVDPIRPVAKGGANDPENLQVLCARCNAPEGRQLGGNCA
jgi:HNH endonuclease